LMYKMSLGNKSKQKATAAQDDMLKKDDVGNELRKQQQSAEEEEEEENELCLPAHRLAVSYFQPALCTSPKRRNDHDSRFNVSQLAANRGAMARQPLGQRIYWMSATDQRGGWGSPSLLRSAITNRSHHFWEPVAVQHQLVTTVHRQWFSTVDLRPVAQRAHLAPVQPDLSALDDVLKDVGTMPRRRSDTWRSNFLAKRNQFARELDDNVQSRSFTKSNHYHQHQYSNHQKQQEQQQQQQQQPRYRYPESQQTVSTKTITNAANHVSLSRLGNQLRYYWPKATTVDRSFSDRDVYDYVVQRCASPVLDGDRFIMTLENGGERGRRCEIQKSSSLTSTGLWTDFNGVEDVSRPSAELSRGRSRQPTWEAWNTVVKAIIDECDEKPRATPTRSIRPFSGPTPTMVNSTATAERPEPDFTELDSILNNLGVPPTKHGNGPHGAGQTAAGKSSAATDEATFGSRPAKSVATRPTNWMINGSVAERILQFEKRPTIPHDRSNMPHVQQQYTATTDNKNLNSSNININKLRVWDATLPTAVFHNSTVNNFSSAKWLTDSLKSTANSLPVVHLTLPRPSLPPVLLASSQNEHIPRCRVHIFYFPCGKPSDPNVISVQLRKCAEIFVRHSGKADLHAMGEVAEACGLPYYVRQPFYHCCRSEPDDGFVNYYNFKEFWKRICKVGSDPVYAFIRLLNGDSANHVIATNFLPMIQDIIDHHPGLSCLREAPTFHSCYAQTVISRIFFSVSLSWSEKITATELRRANFLSTLWRLREEEDINKVTDYFSYEHFYVIYCIFWKLDDDHDMLVDKMDLERYSDYALNRRIIDRIFSTAVNCNMTSNVHQMTYVEFVWFLIAEVDKQHPKRYAMYCNQAKENIEYWFRCMDLDGDGYLSMYELHYFYEEQVERMTEYGLAAVPFTDLICQIFDAVKPAHPDKISLSDLKRCRMSAFFFDTFFNVRKFLTHEDPDSSRHLYDEFEDAANEWDRFAAIQYKNLLDVELQQEEETEMYYCDSDEDLERNCNATLTSLTLA
ncbi:Serine/threonine-protein phosphatase 2A regulatory subunit B'' subunit alpha, partial [Trichinella murrelli]